MLVLCFLLGKNLLLIVFLLRFLFFFLLQPLEGDDELLCQPQSIALEPLNVLLVLRALSADLDGEVSDPQRNGLHLAEKDSDELLISGKFKPILFKVACK